MWLTNFKKFIGPYLEIQQYADNPFTISDECIHYGLCSRVCPCKNIELVNGKPAFQHHCANCMACVTSLHTGCAGYRYPQRQHPMPYGDRCRDPCYDTDPRCRGNPVVCRSFICCEEGYKETGKYDRGLRESAPGNIDIPTKKWVLFIS